MASKKMIVTFEIDADADLANVRLSSIANELAENMDPIEMSDDASKTHPTTYETNTGGIPDGGVDTGIDW
jgi:hypothetical protein